MATSKLQIEVGDLLDKTFPEFHIYENYRPDWLLSPNFTKMELDFFIEELNIAFEIQGQQHYEFTPFFHGDESGFEKRKLYDEEKKNLCDGKSIKLIEIFSLMDAIIEIKTIQEMHDKPDGYILSTPEPTIAYYKYRELEMQLKNTMWQLESYKAKYKTLENKLQTLKNLINTEENKKRRDEKLQNITPNDIQNELLCWQKKALKRIGETVRFESDIIPLDVFTFIETELKYCKTAETIKSLFLSQSIAIHSF